MHVETLARLSVGFLLHRHRLQYKNFFQGLQLACPAQPEVSVSDKEHVACFLFSGLQKGLKCPSANVGCIDSAGGGILDI